MGGTLEKILITFGFIFLFTLAIIMYGVGFANDNSAVISINDEESIQDINSSINSDYTLILNEGSLSSNISTESTVATGSQSTNTGSQFRFKSFKATVSKIFQSANKNLFGNDPTFKIIFSVVITIIVILTGFYVYKAWIGGQPS